MYVTTYGHMYADSLILDGSRLEHTVSDIGTLLAITADIVSCHGRRR